MISWLARGLLMISGTVAGWLIAKDAPQFGLVQAMVGLILLALFVAVVAFWPARWTHVLNRLRKSQ
jgi:hypothetical protein